MVAEELLDFLVLRLVLMLNFRTVWCVISISCGSRALYFGREGMP